MATTTSSPPAISPRTTSDSYYCANNTDRSLPETNMADTELTSFIDALWDEQMCGTPADFNLSDQQRAVHGSLGSFGNLHMIDPSSLLGLPGIVYSMAGGIDKPGHIFQLPQSTVPDLPQYDTSGAFQFNLDHLAAPPMQDHETLYTHQRFADGDDACQRESTRQSSVMHGPYGYNGAWDRSSASHTPSHIGTNDEPETSEIAEPCYARLLHRCLRDTPNHTLTLKEIYAWIRQHTQKARDPKNKGWQNSVRHNLSMNAAFERVSMSAHHGGESKKGSLWRLTPQAIRNGVISTTRYRRDPKRKSDRRGAPAPKRQLSGAKGGAATRAASQARRQLEAQERLARASHNRAQQRFLSSVSTSGVVAPAVAPQHPSFHQIASCQSASASPYFVNSVDRSPVMMQTSYSDPNSPLQVQLSYDEQQKHLLGEFQLQQIDYSQGLFGNSDDGMRVYTPSLQTESSYFTDEPMSAPTSNPLGL